MNKILGVTLIILCAFGIVGFIADMRGWNRTAGVCAAIPFAALIIAMIFAGAVLIWGKA